MVKLELNLVLLELVLVCVGLVGVSLLCLRAHLKTPLEGKNGRRSKEEPAKRGRMWVDLIPVLSLILNDATVFSEGFLPLTPAQWSSVLTAHCTGVCVSVFVCKWTKYNEV